MLSKLKSHFFKFFCYDRKKMGQRGRERLGHGERDRNRLGLSPGNWLTVTRNIADDAHNQHSSA